MNEMLQELPGLDRIRVRFLHLLAERQADIALHALMAWESDDADVRMMNLQSAQNILHQIAGTAGSLGFVALGEAARACEQLIINYLESTPSARTALMHEILMDLDAFVATSQDVINRSV